MTYKLHIISSSLVPMVTNNAILSMPRTELTPWHLQFLPYGSIGKGILFHKPPEGIIDHLKKCFARTLDFFPPLVGGLFIGVTANHAVMDGASFWHFINSWSEISRGLDKISKNPVFYSSQYYVPLENFFFTCKISKNPVFERDFPKGNVAIPVIPLHNENNSPKPVPSPLLVRVFHFSRESVSKLKAKANAEAASNKISSLQAILAHLWKHVARARSKGYIGNLDDNREMYLSLPIGTRARIPLPEGYFGNAIFIPSVGVKEREVIQKGLGHTWLKINAFVAQQTSDSAVIEFIEKWLKDHTLSGLSDFWVTSTPRHNVYGNDFGWGKPFAARSGQWDDGQMTLFPTSELGGIDIEVCLLPETLLELEGDT